MDKKIFLIAILGVALSAGYFAFQAFPAEAAITSDSPASAELKDIPCVVGSVGDASDTVGALTPVPSFLPLNSTSASFGSSTPGNGAPGSVCGTQSYGSKNLCANYSNHYTAEIGHITTTCAQFCGKDFITNQTEEYFGWAEHGCGGKCQSAKTCVYGQVGYFKYEQAVTIIDLGFGSGTSCTNGATIAEADMPHTQCPELDGFGGVTIYSVNGPSGTVCNLVEVAGQYASCSNLGNLTCTASNTVPNSCTTTPSTVPPVISPPCLSALRGTLHNTGTCLG